MTLLDKIGFGDSDKMYILGDVIDRGEKPIDLLEYITKQSNMELILGNHEEMFLSYLSRGKNSTMDLWVDNLGGTTLQQYERLSQERRNNVLDYLQSTDLYKMVGNFILVHAGINISDSKDSTVEKIMESQKKDDLLWIRSDFYRRSAFAGRTVIFGHTPTSVLHDKNYIWFDEKYGDKIGVDCGAAYGGKIGCLRLDDMREFYV
ncbi:MAG: fructose-bisphosphatase class III [Peptococcaceae bacterium]|nr:fructose-bisphosphatase class III [Peptococcaceae bacterium]